MNKLILGRYFPGKSILHHLDPRAKLIAGISFILILFIAKDPLAYVLLWMFTFAVMKLSGISFKIYFRGVKPLIWLIIFTVTLQILFTSGGNIYFAWGPITISEFGIINSLYIFSRFVMIILVSTVVTLTTKPIDLTDGIRSLLSPLKYFKVPVDDLSMMLSIALRFIPNVFDETQKIMDSQKARGAVFGEGSLLQQMKALVPVFLPLFVSTLNRAEDTANAMEVKGYRSDMQRSSFRRLQWKAIDTYCLSIIALLAISMMIIRP